MAGGVTSVQVVPGDNPVGKSINPEGTVQILTSHLRFSGASLRRETAKDKGAFSVLHDRGPSRYSAHP